MNISGSSLPAMSGGGESAEVYSASLAKKQQKADGAAALALIEGAAMNTSAAQTPAKSVTLKVKTSI